MRHKTRGIVLSRIKYKETSLVCRIFTEQFGLQSYIVNGVRSSKSKAGKAAFFQPLTLLDMVVYHKPNANLNRIAELKASHVYQTIHTHQVKGLIAMYLAELLSKALQEDAPNDQMFGFIHDSLVQLDGTTRSVANFHLVFTWELSKWLGFGVDGLEMLEGEAGIGQLSNQCRSCFQMLATDSSDHPSWQLHHDTRREILDLLLKLYRLHIEGFGQLKSLDVLRMMQG